MKSEELLAISEALGLRTHELLASADVRRERNLSATEGYPAWLTGEAPVRGALARYEAPPAPQAAAPPPPTDRDERFVTTLDRLSRRLSDRDKDLILEMAEKLAE